MIHPKHAGRPASRRRVRRFRMTMESLEARRVLSSARPIALLSSESLVGAGLNHATRSHAPAQLTMSSSRAHAESVVGQDAPQISMVTLPSPQPTLTNAVLIHGLNGAGVDLENLGRAIQAVHPETRVIIVDYYSLARPGFAYTNVPSVERNLPDVAREVVAELRAYGISPQNTEVFGYSDGAIVARYMTQLGYNAKTVGIETAVRVSKFNSLPKLDLNIGAGSGVWDRGAAAKGNDYTIPVVKHPLWNTKAAHQRIIDGLIDQIYDRTTPVDERIDEIFEESEVFGRILPSSPPASSGTSPLPTSPSPAKPPSETQPTPSPTQQAQALATAISTAAANPDKPPPPTPNYSAQVLFLVDLADDAFYGPPKPPPDFAIANLINAANNGSVPVAVISQVLYDLDVMFGTSSSGASIGSFYQDIASEAAAGVVSSLVGGLTQWAVTDVTSSVLLGEEAGQFIGSLSGTVVASAIAGDYGGSALESAVGTILSFT